MKNEYGVRLDSNGYAPSIIPGHSNWCCWQCGKNRYLERHEVFGGAYRAKSKAYGLWVHLCESCHRTGGDAVHNTGGNALKERAQRSAMDTYGWTIEEFRARFGKNYVEENDDAENEKDR